MDKVIQQGKDLPKWAVQKATGQDFRRTKQSIEHGTYTISGPDTKTLKTWAKQQGWPTSWFGFNHKFVQKMLESEANFALALQDAGLVVWIPRESYRISKQQLQSWDAMYEEREDMGALGMRPTRLGSLVENLREVRRAIEAQVFIEIDNRQLHNVGSFLKWVDERYHMLEDGYDSWVGDDRS